MIKEGASVDKNTILAVIEQFNRKTADLPLSGNSVNTGLLTLMLVSLLLFLGLSLR